MECHCAARREGFTAHGRRVGSVLDFSRVNALSLRFPDHDRNDLALGQGVHAFGRADDGALDRVEHREDALVQFCIDRRGVWLQSRAPDGAVHVNGRPVRRMAMLRAGDAIHLEGAELVLLGTSPGPMPKGIPNVRESDRRAVLRGVGGPSHGRCFSLDHAREIGRDVECDIRIDGPAIAERHARLEPHQDGIVLRDLGGANVVVNGHAVREGLLQAGDQLVVGSHRFVIEAPLSPGIADATAVPEDGHDTEATDDAPSPVASSIRRMPWLLLAAVMLAAALTLLLMFGAR